MTRIQATKNGPPTQLQVVPESTAPMPPSVAETLGDIASFSVGWMACTQQVLWPYHTMLVLLCMDFGFVFWGFRYVIDVQMMFHQAEGISSAANLWFRPQWCVFVPFCTSLLRNNRIWSWYIYHFDRWHDLAVWVMFEALEMGFPGEQALTLSGAVGMHHVQTQMYCHLRMSHIFHVYSMYCVHVKSRRLNLFISGVVEAQGERLSASWIEFTLPETQPTGYMCGMQPTFWLKGFS